MKSKPVIVKGDNNSVELISINPQEKKFSENWLQELLDQNPQILPVDQIEAVFSPLASIGREIATDVGRIDNLFISSRGYPVIVETKLWRNSEARREVVAQVIDYAACFSKWSFSKFNDVCKEKTQKGILDFLEDSFDLDPEELPDEESIAKNLQQGRFLLLIVGDKIQHSVIDMLGYINQYPGLSSNIGMVELQTYRMPESANDILVVPNVVAKTEIVERSVVQVTVMPTMEHHVEVEQVNVRNQDKSKSIGKHILSDDAFWEKFRQNTSPNGLTEAKEIYKHFDDDAEIEMKNRQTAIVPRLSIPETSRKISLFYLNMDGTVSCQKSNLRDKLMDLGYPSDFADDYYDQLAKLFSDDPSAKNIKQKAAKIKLVDFIALVEEFIAKIRSSDYSIEED